MDGYLSELCIEEHGLPQAMLERKNDDFTLKDLTVMSCSKIM